MCKDGKYCDNVYVHACMHVIVVVVVVVLDIVKRRAVKIMLTCFNSFHIFWLLQFQCFPGRRVYWNMNTVGIQKSVSFLH